MTTTTDVTQAQVVTRAINRTDTGNEELFARQHCDRLRYAPGLGWLAWNGVVWERDDASPIRAAQETARSLIEDGLASSDDDRRKSLIKQGLELENANRLRAMVSLAETHPLMRVRADELDNDPWLLNCLNGVVDLRTGALLEHSPHRLITKMCNTHYDPQARSDLWESFLNDTFQSKSDLISAVARLYGYSATGSNREQIMVIGIGGGANGKSVLAGAIAHTLGDYAVSANTSTFMGKRENGPSGDVARLRGARFISTIETQDGSTLNESLIKSITGGDKIVTRYMYRDEFEFSMTGKVFLSTNHKPIIRGTDWAIWRRLVLVPFKYTVPEHKRDKDLGDKLANEASAILAWVVNGCLDWQRQGLNITPEMRTAVDDYRTDMDTLQAFIDERCDVGDTLQETAGKLYGAYCNWAQGNNDDVMSSKAFGMRLKESGFDKTRTGVRIWKGIILKVNNSNGQVTP